MRRKTIVPSKKIMISVFWVFSLCMFGQQITVRGTVTDTEGETLTGVTVQVQGTTIGSVTDAQGIFILSDLAKDAW